MLFKVGDVDEILTFYILNHLSLNYLGFIYIKQMGT